MDRTPCGFFAGGQTAVRDSMPLNLFKKPGSNRLLLLLGLLVSAPILAAWLFLNVESAPGHRQLKSLLIGKLVMERPLPASPKASGRSKDVIYVLGGSEGSLKKRFATAASLYRSGVASRVLILSKPGITEYDEARKRNKTNDEWAIDELTGLGVEKRDIEPMPRGKGFFGTFTEAKEISAAVLKRGAGHLVLVTSSYHTERAWLSFSKFMKGHESVLCIYPAEDGTDLEGLLIEYLKLVIYRNFLL